MSSNQASSPKPLGRHIRGLSETANADPETWPTLDEGVLEGDQRTRYLARKLGVRMYLSGHSEESIRKKCGLGLKQIYRLITERCILTHSDGLIYGWRGLIPNLRIKPYARQKTVRVDAFGRGAAGAMNAILDLHPEFRKPEGTWGEWERGKTIAISIAPMRARFVQTAHYFRNDISQPAQTP